MDKLNIIGLTVYLLTTALSNSSLSIPISVISFCLMMWNIYPLFFPSPILGFWKKVDVYREQPDVSFKHKMLFVLETKSPEELVFWSTYKNLNKLINPQAQKIMPSIEVSKIVA